MFKGIRIKFINKVRDFLYISKQNEELKEQIRVQNKKIAELLYRYDATIKRVSNVEQDNEVIKKHLNHLNNDFFVIADIQSARCGNHVVLVFHKSGQKIIKEYTFSNNDIKSVKELLSGFGKQNVHINDRGGYFQMMGNSFRY